MKKIAAIALVLTLVAPLTVMAANPKIVFDMNQPASPMTGKITATGNVSLDTGWSVVNGGNAELIAAKKGGGQPGGDATALVDLNNNFSLTVSGLTAGSNYIIFVRSRSRIPWARDGCWTATRSRWPSITKL